MSSATVEADVESLSIKATPPSHRYTLPVNHDRDILVAAAKFMDDVTNPVLATNYAVLLKKHHNPLVRAYGKLVNESVNYYLAAAHNNRVSIRRSMNPELAEAWTRYGGVFSGPFWGLSRSRTMGWWMGLPVYPVTSVSREAHLRDTYTLPAIGGYNFTFDLTGINQLVKVMDYPETCIMHVHDRKRTINGLGLFERWMNGLTKGRYPSVPQLQVLYHTIFRSSPGAVRRYAESLNYFLSTARHKLPALKLFVIDRLPLEHKTEAQLKALAAQVGVRLVNIGSSAPDQGCVRVNSYYFSDSMRSVGGPPLMMYCDMHA